MISCINPSYISSNHTINTLRYSDRLKEQTAYMQKQIINNKLKINPNNYNNNNTQQQQQQQHQNKNNNNNINTNKQRKEIDREKELEEINMNVFSAKDDILNDINFDEKINLEDDLLEFKKINDTKNYDISNKNKNIDNNNNNELSDNNDDDESLITSEKNLDNNSEKLIDDEMEDLIYLKKTVSKDGKFISDDFIKYHKLTDTIIQDEDDIINTHMEVIKQDAKLLTEEGKLISLIKGIGNEEENVKENSELELDVKDGDEKEKIINEELEDLIYLKKKVSKDGKFISDDFIKYHKLTDQIIEDEDDIVATHMDVIKQDAKMLTEEGELITKIKGIEYSEENFSMEEYLKRLEKIIDKKIDIYSGLQNKIDVYKQHIKDEEKMRKEHPQLFVDPADY